MPQILSRLGAVQRLLREAALSTAAPKPDTQGRHLRAEGAEGDRVDHRLQLLDTPITLRVHSWGQGGLRYLNLHENEQTAVLAAADLLQTLPGQLIELRSRGRRVVSFRDGLRPLAFDPNRIFSDAGIEQTLTRHASCTPAAQQALRALRDRVLALVEGPPDQAVVALHNNRAGPYSILQYRPGGAHAPDAQALAINPRLAPQDFFLVTRASLFEPLREQGFNVVLQAEQAADDGSLSVWFGRQRRAYVNVEALHGHRAEQRQMLAAVAALQGFSPPQTPPAAAG